MTPQPSATAVDGSTGSVFCPYTATSNNYDATRKPLGIAATLGAFAHAGSGVPLHKQRFLDVGGGTGSFMKEVHRHFGQCALFEYDGGMLKKAEERLSDTGVECKQGSADALPFEDASFDAITINQVIHHFPQADGYAFLAKCLKECSRVLAPGGTLVINMCTHEQHQQAYWWFKLMPKACAAYCAASPPIDLCLEYLRNARLNVDPGEIYTPLDGTLMSEETYLRKHGLEGAFVKEYRDGDSGFTMGERTGEIESMQAKIREIQAAGDEHAWIAAREAERKRVGQATFVIARKAA